MTTANEIILRANEFSLDKFEHTFKANVFNWVCNKEGYHFRMNSDYTNNQNDLKGKSLVKFLVERYGNVLFNEMPYKERKDFSEWYKIRTFDMKEGGLTGDKADILILKPIYDFIQNPDKEITLYDLMKKCFDSFFSHYQLNFNIN